MSDITYWLYFTDLWQNLGQNLPLIFYLLYMVSFAPVRSPIVSCTWALVPSLCHGIRDGWAWMTGIDHCGRPLSVMAVFASDRILYYMVWLPSKNSTLFPQPWTLSTSLYPDELKSLWNYKTKQAFPPLSCYCYLFCHSVVRRN